MAISKPTSLLLLLSGLAILPFGWACDQSATAPSAPEALSQNLCNPGNGANLANYCDANSACCSDQFCQFTDPKFGMCCDGAHQDVDGTENLQEGYSCCSYLSGPLPDGGQVCCSGNGQSCNSDWDCCLSLVPHTSPVLAGPPISHCNAKHVCCAMDGQPCPNPALVIGWGGACCDACDATTGTCAACIPMGHTGCAKDAECCANLKCDIDNGVGTCTQIGGPGAPCKDPDDCGQACVGAPICNWLPLTCGIAAPSAGTCCLPAGDPCDMNKCCSQKCTIKNKTATCS
jgi:hypothetical protein